MCQAEAIDIIENYVEEFDSYEFEDPRGIPELYRQIRSAQREAGCILMDLIMANPDEDPKNWLRTVYAAGTDMQTDKHNTSTMTQPMLFLAHLETQVRRSCGVY